MHLGSKIKRITTALVAAGGLLFVMGPMSDDAMALTNSGTSSPVDAVLNINYTIGNALAITVTGITDNNGHVNTLSAAQASLACGTVDLTCTRVPTNGCWCVVNNEPGATIYAAYQSVVITSGFTNHDLQINRDAAGANRPRAGMVKFITNNAFPNNWNLIATGAAVAVTPAYSDLYLAQVSGITRQHEIAIEINSADATLALQNLAITYHVVGH